MVVDRDVGELPAGVALGAAAITGDAKSYARDSAQLFRIQMQQLTRPLALVAAHRWTW